MAEHKQSITVSLSIREFSTMLGVLATFGLEHPDKSIGVRALEVRGELCRQADHDGSIGLEVAHETLYGKRNRR